MTTRSALRTRFWDGLPKLQPVPDELRGSLAASWLHAAQTEHASIASFGQFALQLLALGAPADLVERAHMAALDEIEHARICFALASAYGSERYGPGALDAVTGGFSSDFQTVVCANVDEGCVGETLAALEAQEAARRATDPTVRSALEAIAFDEEQHAQLGWSVWGWALGAAPELRGASEAAFESALAGTRAGLPDDATGEELEAHGRLANCTRRALALRNINEVLIPAKKRLFTPNI
ncbi:MAG: ferritin-like domain-containing protein [Polyangiales bacterium]